MTTGFVIFDIVTNRRHVPRVWPTRHEAEVERADLLRHHAAGSQWLVRLEVRSERGTAKTGPKGKK